jgi:HAD superfamily hydrolase (TIGR01509 family)
MIKTIIFDNGGVLTRDPWLIYIEALSRGKSREIYKVAKSDLLPVEAEAIVGRKSFKEFQEELERVYPIDIRVAQIIEGLSANYEVALLSNDLGNFEENNKVWKFEELFGKNIFHSSKMGLRKPDPKAFEYVLEKMDIKPSETLFVDDKERNTKVAESLGIKSIIFKDPETLRVELKNLLK